METSLFVDVVSKLGVAGFAIWIMYLMYLKNIEWHKEKDESHSSTISGINNKLFEVIGENTEAIKENSKVIREIVGHRER